jgi:tetratricopeptide (TPR) repeat protein
MAKQKGKPTERESRGLGSHLLPMLLSAAVGAGVTWVVMSQRSQPVQQQPVSFVTQPSGQHNQAPLRPDLSTTSAADAAVVKGNQAYDHQQWTEAINYYQEAIAKGRDNPDVRTDLGNAFRFSGQSEKALEQYTIAQRQNPQHEHSLFNQIGLFMEVIHDPIRAIPICEEFIKRFPNSPNVPRVKEQLQTAKNL